MAYNLHKAFIPIRKQGKLPRATSRMSYELEYGMETIEVHRDDIKPGMKIVVVDDLIATGGTLEAAVHLLEQLGAKVVKVVCLLELEGSRTDATALKPVRRRRLSLTRGSK